jgi:hypothetical protein
LRKRGAFRCANPLKTRRSCARPRAPKSSGKGLLIRRHRSIFSQRNQLLIRKAMPRKPRENGHRPELTQVFERTNLYGS